MSADCQWKLTIKSELNYISNILAFLNTIDQGAFLVSENTIETDNGLATNIWGKYSYMNPDVETYLELAKAAPKAEWEVESSVQYEGGGGNDQSYLEVKYTGGILSFSKSTYVNQFWCDPDYWYSCKYKIYNPETEEKAESLIEEQKAKKRDIYEEEDDYSEEETTEPVYERDWDPAEPAEGIYFAVSGRSKIFGNMKLLNHAIWEINGRVSVTVCKRTGYLIDCKPEQETVKKRRARELGIPVISEEEFICRFHNPNLLNNAILV